MKGLRVFIKNSATIPHIDIAVTDGSDPNLLAFASAVKVAGMIYNDVVFIPWENILCVLKIDDNGQKGPVAVSFPEPEGKIN